MNVSRQQSTASDDAERATGPVPERGPRARTKRLMLETATRLMQAGVTPSVSEVAEAAEVSRATAYRYFPSQSALVQAVVDEGLGPILTWQSTSADAERRVAELFDTAMPRIEAFEATFKAALKLSLDQWARRQAGTLGAEPAFTRGHRIDLLKDAIAPLKSRLPPRDFKRLAQALSLIFGVEVLIVLKDIWGLDSRRTRAVAQWAAGALVRAAVAESVDEGGSPDPKAVMK
ncbi:TetR/AcrR family transcriptional regulator [Mesorhizobium sp. M7A.F.Ca.CA.001.07.2.1]|jgi:AcrR family transcriptional regulator|uniref:TetR/AcrR family transcriptional regulator n=1 Tax=Mesorhizobium TaxID=68287 RepID=UPI000FCAF87E|nr:MULTISPECIES: TetR/AcrR family transcriptional regulator [Mesorhizobium]RWN22880.1 MAG: TetR/AcrR family transcriptional regulator [Mesorhizobium sp.]MCF6123838.1 TetR/AcrR family transcriptional regulator [Mesorhizobium ciceri]MCQ8814836.1 TetR/AcrR family transcriptional regulator [Mesorhizobium sp. SEMIA396]RUX70290.1 TetR/AcrR family transcriptional regulator [Mesorhizobium sp. M7A.F.Ca.CA.004.08.2.1]RUX84356.1 TetR/AcrR family transcriptional regulator [Mesorhizobium sp. M7A.F.Ca.CA.00